VRPNQGENHVAIQLRDEVLGPSGARESRDARISFDVLAMRLDQMRCALRPEKERLGRERTGGYGRSEADAPCGGNARLVADYCNVLQARSWLRALCAPSCSLELR
jgi:hypothetical protein